MLHEINKKISILDRYILKRLIPYFTLSLSICIILGELIGITFEQIRLVANNQISTITSIYVHLLKLPDFISKGFPFALLLAALLTLSNLSTKNEITALRTFGVSLFRINAPVLVIGLILSFVVFAFHELVVPPANYQAAILLEREWNIDRSELAKYSNRDILFPKYISHKLGADLEFLFFARRFDGEKMKDVTLLKYRKSSLDEIIVSHYAQWDELSQSWNMISGCQYLLDADGSYAQINPFQNLPIKLTRKIVDYVSHYRDQREMNILELYHRLSVIQDINDARKIRQLKIGIQERYALPFSCFVFAFLGSSLGINSGNAGKANCFGLATITIFTYFISQFISNTLIIVGILPVLLGVWWPNLLGLSYGYFLVHKKQ